MQENFINATQTQVVTKVSTKTQVLLGLLIVACAGGMFGIAISLKPPTKPPIADTIPLDPEVNLSNMFNGTGGDPQVMGGTALAGGVDDYNNGQNAPIDRYIGTWTRCNIRNRYCGTGNQFAQIKDNNTGLIWSMPCAGLGCSSPSNSTTTIYYSWDGEDNQEQYDDITFFNNGLTAQELCTNLGPGWYLPHQKQLLQAYIDGAYGNLEPIGVNSAYWSSTQISSGPIIIGTTVSLSTAGGVDNDDLYGNYRIRCIYYGNSSSNILSNLFNGTGILYSYGYPNTIEGGTPINGGVVDYNNGQNAPSNTYSALWQACGNINNYCGTGDTFAQLKDNNTGLVWSMPCAGLGCSSPSNSTTTMHHNYSWNGNSGQENFFHYNNGMTAQELCTNLGPGWYLPHQKQLLQAYIDGAYGNLEPIGVNSAYCSATTVSYSTNGDGGIYPPDGYWNVYLSNALLGIGSKSNPSYGCRIRCVHN